MRGGGLILGVLLLLPAGCGGHPSEPAQKPVVLWQSGLREPEFPLPPEARWAPIYQKLRCKLEGQTGTPYRWTCFAGGDFGTVLHFYAERFGVQPGSVPVERRPVAEVLGIVRGMAARLGHPVPGGREHGGMVRIARLGPSGRLPVVRLESPYLDLDTGALRKGTLISMRWRPREEAP